MKLPGKVVDERFWVHRQRSTSLAGIAGGVLSICLFEYRYWVNHRWDWDLLAVGLTFVVVKMALMTWYYLTD
jgi:hypothetical protein